MVREALRLEVSMPKKANSIEEAAPKQVLGLASEFKILTDYANKNNYYFEKIAVTELFPDIITVCSLNTKQLMVELGRPSFPSSTYSIQN